MRGRNWRKEGHGTSSMVFRFLSYARLIVLFKIPRVGFLHFRLGPQWAGYLGTCHTYTSIKVIMGRVDG
jgi:hypothetical protein